MSAATRLRGQPVFVLATILGGWTVMRALLWTSPFPVTPAVVERDFAASSPVQQAARSGTGTAARPMPDISSGPAAPAPWRAPAPLPAPWSTDPGLTPAPPAWNAVENAPTDAASRATRMKRIGGQYLLLAAGFSNMTLPPEIAALYPNPSEAGEPGRKLASADRPLLGNAGRASERAGRWSADGWLLWRDGSGTSAAPGAASYGRSQGGAVVRYRLAAGPSRPEAYARATHTLEGPRQGELAAGLSLRPIAGLPVRLAAEGRVTDGAVGRELRPAVFAVTELAPAKVPLGLRGEAYAQAGYVGGRDATAFVDGQARVDGRLARLGDGGEMRLGLAAWGGAQRGASRFDLGPSASLGFRLGEAQSRVALDYRVRVAGEAEPKSGPAVTFSAGF